MEDVRELVHDDETLPAVVGLQRGIRNRRDEENREAVGGIRRRESVGRVDIIGQCDIDDPARRVRSTCHPASFPLSAAERIDSLRVGFYRIQCPPGVTKPPNSSGRLPEGCLGNVTATPKDKFFNDVDARIHGPYITWELEQRRGFVAMRDDENTPFNKALRAQGTGDFALCATVQGHRGCLEGTVTEN